MPLFSTLIFVAFIVERFVKVWIWVFISMPFVIERGVEFVIVSCGLVMLQVPLLQISLNSLEWRFVRIAKIARVMNNGAIPPPP